jgi:hypothetical protein
MSLDRYELYEDTSASMMDSDTVNSLNSTVFIPQPNISRFRALGNWIRETSKFGILRRNAIGGMPSELGLREAFMMLHRGNAIRIGITGSQWYRDRIRCSRIWPSNVCLARKLMKRQGRSQRKLMKRQGSKSDAVREEIKSSSPINCRKTTG